MRSDYQPINWKELFTNVEDTYKFDQYHPFTNMNYL